MANSNAGKAGRMMRLSRDVPQSRDAQQFQSHLQVLANIDTRVMARLDAIIVPASRAAANLDHAVTLARAVGCWLVVLCSLNAQAEEVNNLLDLRNFNQAIVIDLPDGYAIPDLDLATSRLDNLGLPRRCVSPNGDLSVKRNIGLLLSRMLGWERIFFLDDDIRDLEWSDLCEAATMLGPYGAVGMRAVDFPDNSVVCHGHRKTGGYQDVFISGSVLGIFCSQLVAFFPEIYNEDWFFFYPAARNGRLGRHSRDVTQLRYDPFANPERAAGQEFGDIMAEGLYGLLHNRISIEQATSDYWRMFLSSRMSFLQGVLTRSDRIEPLLRKRIVSSIQTAIAWCRQIEPLMCEHYINLWQRDLGIWKERLSRVPTGISSKAALAELDLASSGPSAHALAGIMSDRAYGRYEEVIAPDAGKWSQGINVLTAGRHRRDDSYRLHEIFYADLVELSVRAEPVELTALTELSATCPVPQG